MTMSRRKDDPKLSDADLIALAIETREEDLGRGANRNLTLDCSHVKGGHVLHFWDGSSTIVIGDPSAILALYLWNGETVRSLWLKPYSQTKQECAERMERFRANAPVLSQEMH
jgi:hypothetical protein